MGSEECNSNTSWRTGKLSINSKQSGIAGSISGCPSGVQVSFQQIISEEMHLPLESRRVLSRYPQALSDMEVNTIDEFKHRNGRETLMEFSCLFFLNETTLYSPSVSLHHSLVIVS